MRESSIDRMNAHREGWLGDESITQPRQAPMTPLVFAALRANTIRKVVIGEIHFPTSLKFDKLVYMKTIGAFDAKTHLSELLKKVAHGESFLITKRGKPVAALSPVTTDTRHGPKDLIADFRKRFAKSLKSFSVQEIIELKETGRR